MPGMSMSRLAGARPTHNVRVQGLPRSRAAWQGHVNVRRRTGSPWRVFVSSDVGPRGTNRASCRHHSWNYAFRRIRMPAQRRALCLCRRWTFALTVFMLWRCITTRWVFFVPNSSGFMTLLGACGAWKVPARPRRFWIDVIRMFARATPFTGWRRSLPMVAILTTCGAICARGPVARSHPSGCWRGSLLTGQRR